MLSSFICCICHFSDNISEINMLKSLTFILFFKIYLIGFILGFHQETCGIANSVSRIFDGQEISNRKYPWLVHLSVQKELAKSFCGGVLISERMVLTAANCVHNMKESSDSISWTPVGAEAINVHVDLISTNDEKHISMPQPVEKIMSGIFFQDDMPGYDIALLVLKSPVKISRKTAPICLLTTEDEPFRGKKLLVAGWGDTSTKWFGKISKAFSTPKHAHEAEVVHITDEKCTQQFGEITGFSNVPLAYNPKREVCAIGVNSMADACEGDAGGPLMWKNPDDGRFYLVGIVARGPECPNKKKSPGIYTKIEPYMDFITKIQNGEKLEYEMMSTKKDIALKKLEEITTKMGF